MRREIYKARTAKPELLEVREDPRPLEEIKASAERRARAEINRRVLGGEILISSAEGELAQVKAKIDAAGDAYAIERAIAAGLEPL